MAGGSVGFVTYRYYPLGIAFTPVPQGGGGGLLYWGTLLNSITGK